VKIRKAIIAAAGQGTRFLPQTKAKPKEMLPLIDKPIIQYIVEELVEAGIEDIVIVTGYHKRSIEDHFDEPSSDLVETLSRGNENKQKLLEELQNIANLANFIYIRQKNYKGNAAPILNSEHIIGDEPFIYTYGDDFIKASPGRFKQLVDVYSEHQTSVISCLNSDKEEDYKHYGYIGGQNIGNNLTQISTIVEKPGSKESSPSSLASLSSYIFNPTIFDSLHQIEQNHNPEDELSLQKAMQLSIDSGEGFLAYEVQNAKYYDSGNKLEYLKTIVDLGLQHPEIGNSFREYVRQRIDQ
jgi:UTP--glucose-1-phosphate uridylyltransferase